uniref:Uncharacterized protein n=1 Tax=Pseudonaja textilis TaxID=8673 RepID=A0A670ZV07_PSETE
MWVFEATFSGLHSFSVHKAIGADDSRLGVNLKDPVGPISIQDAVQDVGIGAGIAIGCSHCQHFIANLKVLPHALLILLLLKHRIMIVGRGRFGAVGAATGDPQRQQ